MADGLVAYNPDSIEGIEAILAALEEIRPQFESKRTWVLANRRLEALAAAAGFPVLGSLKSFDPDLHPRGPDGRFIFVFSWVRWFDFNKRKWVRGKIMDIDDDTGVLTVHRRIDNENVEVSRFTREQASKQLYAQPKPKATIEFPDVTVEDDNGGWKRIGEQGGFNPGGTFELDTQDGVQAHDWTENDMDFLFGGRPSVEIIGLISDQEQFDDDDFSDRLKAQLNEKYSIEGVESETADIWNQIPSGLPSEGGVIVWEDVGAWKVATVNREEESEQRSTPKGKWRSNYVFENWLLRRAKAKLLPQNPERKLHPTWRRVVYGIGPDVARGVGMGGPSVTPRMPDLGSETAEGITEAASSGLRTAAEIRDAATGALVTLESIIQADPKAKFFPFEFDTDLIGDGDRLQQLINGVLQPAVRPGDKFYVKDLSRNHTGADWVANEITANRLYELAGVPVPDVFQGNDPAKMGSRMIGGELKDVREYLDDPEVMARVREGFTVDAWLANWDVAGNTFDNIVVDEDGIPYRIDAGGALAYSGAGDPKGDMFGATVGELESLGPDSPFTASKAPVMFAGLTDQEKVAGAQRVAGISPEQIRDLALETGVDQNVTDTLIARRAYIIDHLLGGVDPFASDEPETVPEGLEEVEPTGEQKADLGLLEEIEAKAPDVEAWENPALGEPEPVAPPVPAAIDPTEFPPALDWSEAWSWSGQSSQWVTSQAATGAPDVDVLEGRWLDRIEEVNEQVGRLEATGVPVARVPAEGLVATGALDNPNAVLLVTSSMNTTGGRTDMFVPWGTDIDGNAVLMSRISGQTVTPAKDWPGIKVPVTTLDLSAVEDPDTSLNELDRLMTIAADAQVSYEASLTDFSELAKAKNLGWKKVEDIGRDPMDVYLLGDDKSVMVTRMANGGLTLTDLATFEPLFTVSPGEFAAFGDPDEVITTALVFDTKGEPHVLTIPDRTGQQVLLAKAEMELLQQRTAVAEAGEYTNVLFPKDVWVQPDPNLYEPDVSTDVTGSKPIPTGADGGPELPDDWDYESELVPGTYIDTSQPTFIDPENPGPVHPGLPHSVPELITVDFGGANGALEGQWIMHDVDGFRHTRQPVLVTSVIKDDNGLVGIAVQHSDGSTSMLEGPKQSRIHIVEPPKHGKNIPMTDSEIVMGHNGDIRLGKEVIGSWWHADKNISHRHTYGYMVDGDYTAHGKATIGFRTHARDVRKQVRSEVWFADNYEPVEAEVVPKGAGAKTLEGQVKSSVVPGHLGTTGEPWAVGQPVNKTKGWGADNLDSQGVIVAGVHPDRPDLVYYRDHVTGTVTMEDAAELTDHATGPGSDATGLIGSTFTVDGEQWYINNVGTETVTAYSVVDGISDVIPLSELPEVDPPSPWSPVSMYEGTFLTGALSSDTAKQEWEAVGGSLLADGEIPLPGTQVVDGAGVAWRVQRVGPDNLFLSNGIVTAERPASEFRVDRARHGGELGLLGDIELRAGNGKVIDFKWGQGDVLYVHQHHFMVLTASGEFYNFDSEDGWEEAVLNTTEHGPAIQNMLALAGAHRVGVKGTGDQNVVVANQKGQMYSSSLVGSLEDAKAGLLTKDGTSKVVSYLQTGVNVEVDPTGGDEEDSRIELPSGASISSDYRAVLVVSTEDMEWFPPPGDRRPMESCPAGVVPRIVGGGPPDEMLNGKTFPMSENVKTLAEAIEAAWDNVGEDVEGKTVQVVQADQDVIEDFMVQVMPVVDKTTGEQYVEVFFRPLEGYSDELYNALVEPPLDPARGRWRPTDRDQPADRLAIDEVIAVRRGPSGTLTNWTGDASDFATARVISDARVIGTDSNGRSIHEFDVMLPNGKAAKVVQQDALEYFYPLTWTIETPTGEEVQGPQGSEPWMSPLRIAKEAHDAGWKMTHHDVASQVPHESPALTPTGVKLIDIENGTYHGGKFQDPRRSVGAAFRRELGDKTSVWVSLSKPEANVTTERNNFGRQVFIQVPRGDRGAEEIAQSISAGMEAVGLSTEKQTLPTQAAMSDWALNTIGQHFGLHPNYQPGTGSSTVGTLQPGRRWTQAEVEELLANEVSPRIGREVTLADFEFTVDPDGRLMVTANQELAEHIATQTGWISHRHESGVSRDDPPDALIKAVARSLGKGKIGDNIGPAGRTAAGIWAGGQSSDTDMQNGAGNRYYSWTQDEDPPPAFKGGDFGFNIMYDDEVFQRFLGTGMSTGDNYGKRTGSSESIAYSIESWTRTPTYTDHNEGTLKYGIDNDIVELIVVPDVWFGGSRVPTTANPHGLNIIDELKGMGLSEVNGRPIEEIVVPASLTVSMLERRKARKNRPNAGFYPSVGSVSQVLAGEPVPEMERFLAPPLETVAEGAVSETVEVPVEAEEVVV